MCISHHPTHFCGNTATVIWENWARINYWLSGNKCIQVQSSNLLRLNCKCSFVICYYVFVCFPCVLFGFGWFFFISTCLSGDIVNKFVCGREGASTIAPMSNCPIILNRAILINFDLASGFAIAIDHQSLINSQNAGHDLELLCYAVWSKIHHWFTEKMP